jgi:hypothetical protein
VYPVNDSVTRVPCLADFDDGDLWRIHDRSFVVLMPPIH